MRVMLIYYKPFPRAVLPSQSALVKQLLLYITVLVAHTMTSALLIRAWEGLCAAQAYLS